MLPEAPRVVSESVPVLPESVISAVRVFYNWIPMIMSIILFVAFVTTFHLERDLKNLRKDKTVGE